MVGDWIAQPGYAELTWFWISTGISRLQAFPDELGSNGAAIEPAYQHTAQRKPADSTPIPDELFVWCRAIRVSPNPVFFFN
jgi:hypothetical protein